MPQTIMGTYRHGQIVLDQSPLCVDETRVQIQFPDPTPTDVKPVYIQHGMYRTDNQVQTTWDDFMEVKNVLKARDL